jgi:Cytochrome B561
MIAGYLISTSEGVGIPVFGLFEVPALISNLPDQADVAGVVHLYLAWAVVIFARASWSGCFETPLYRS